MIGAYAEGYRVLKDDRYRQAAEKVAGSLLALMTGPDGRLLRTARGGKAKLAAYLEDYAFLTHALLRLHAATGDPKPLSQARALADRMIADFADPANGGFFYTAGDHEALLARVKDPYDNALPGANSMAIRALVALGVATGEGRYLDEAGRALDAFASSLLNRPGGSPMMLLGLEEYLDARPPKADDAPSAPLPGATGVVTARASASKPATVAPGGEFEVALALTIKPGYHIYANPPGSEDVIATVLTLKAGSKDELLGVDYPDGESKILAASGTARVNVYEKETKLTARVRLAPDAGPGTTTVVLRVRYQACDDRACLAPATLEVPATVEVKGR